MNASGTLVTLYSLEDRVREFNNGYPKVEFYRLKFLARPINWLIGALGGFYISKESHIQRITIDTEKMDRCLMQCLNENMKFHREELKCFVIGKKQYIDLVRDVSPSLCYPIGTDYNSRMFCGIKLVVHPSIDGVVPLNFAPD